MKNRGNSKQITYGLHSIPCQIGGTGKEKTGLSTCNRCTSGLDNKNVPFYQLFRKSNMSEVLFDTGMITSDYPDNSFYLSGNDRIDQWFIRTAKCFPDLFF